MFEGSRWSLELTHRGHRKALRVAKLPKSPLAELAELAGCPRGGRLCICAAESAAAGADA